MAPKIWEPRDQHSPGTLSPARSVKKRAWVRGWVYVRLKATKEDRWNKSLEFTHAKFLLWSRKLWQCKSAWYSICWLTKFHSKKTNILFGVVENALNNVVLSTLFNVVNNIVQYCCTWVRANSGSTMLNNVVDDIEQCGQPKIVQFRLWLFFNNPEQVVRSDFSPSLKITHSGYKDYANRRRS